MGTLSDTSSPRLWWGAVALSVLLHLLLLKGMDLLPRGAPAEEARAAPPMEFVFAPERPEDAPRRFAELPEDRAEEAPERADFLSNVDSRARDAEPGPGEGTLPRMDGRSEIEQLPMAAPAEMLPEPSVPDRPLEGPGDILEAYREFKRGEAAAASPEDFIQEPLSNADGSVTLMGEVSLNTAAWIFGHWMKSFRRRVMREWTPPYAFEMGMLQGWTLVEIAVDRSGRLLRCEVLDEEGHESLRVSSVNAIETAGPYDAFPAAAPEDEITLRIKMIYSHYTGNEGPRRRGAR